MATLKTDQQSSLGNFDPDLSETFFRYSDFGITSVNTKTFILMLAQQDPLSYLSSAPINLRAKLKDANRTEFHHLMPRAFVKTDFPNFEFLVNSLANFAFLSRADNREIGGVAPSIYRQKMQGDVSAVLRKSLVPESLFTDVFVDFIDERDTLLTDAAYQLCQAERPDDDVPF